MDFTVRNTRDNNVADALNNTLSEEIKLLNLHTDMGMISLSNIIGIGVLDDVLTVVIDNEIASTHTFEMHTINRIIITLKDEEMTKPEDNIYDYAELFGQITEKVQGELLQMRKMLDENNLSITDLALAVKKASPEVIETLKVNFTEGFKEIIENTNNDVKVDVATAANEVKSEKKKKSKKKTSKSKNDKKTESHIHNFTENDTTPEETNNDFLNVTRGENGKFYDEEADLVPKKHIVKTLMGLNEYDTVCVSFIDTPQGNITVDGTVSFDVFGDKVVIEGYVRHGDRMFNRYGMHMVGTLVDKNGKLDGHVEKIVIPKI